MNQPISTVCTGDNLAALALGSNLGDSREILRGAIATLQADQSLTVVQCSNWYQTPAIGPPQPDYLNGCLLVRYQKTALELLDWLLAVEQQFGRARTIHWGPRTLDLDLLWFGTQIIESDRLILPHPRLHERGFVLKPLAELCPNWIHPTLHRTVQDLLQHSDLSGIQVIE